MPKSITISVEAAIQKTIAGPLRQFLVQHKATVATTAAALGSGLLDSYVSGRLTWHTAVTSLFTLLAGAGRSWLDKGLPAPKGSDSA